MPFTMSERMFEALFLHGAPVTVRSRFGRAIPPFGVEQIRVSVTAFGVNHPRGVWFFRFRLRSGHRRFLFGVIRDQPSMI